MGAYVQSIYVSGIFERLEYPKLADLGISDRYNPECGTAVKGVAMGFCRYGWIVGLVLGGLAHAEPGPSQGVISCTLGEPQQAQCIGRTNGKVTRAGNVLKLALDGGKTRTIKSDPKACKASNQDKCVINSLLSYRPAEGLYVIDWVLAEGGGSQVVSQAGGKDVIIDNAAPVFSPSGKLFAAAMSSELEPPDHDLAIWSLREGVLKVEWAYKNPEGKHALWDGIEWQGEDGFRVKMTYFTGDGEGEKSGQASVLRIADGWKLVKPEGAP